MTTPTRRPARTRSAGRGTAGRRLGVVLLLAVLVATVVSARLGGERVSGAAFPRAGFGAPQAGDCIADSANPEPDADGSWPPFTVLAESAVRIGDCASPHRGEVVAFLLLTAPGPAGNPPDDDKWCRTVSGGYDAMTYLSPRAPESSGWTPVRGHRYVVVTNASTESFAGRRWVACAVVSPRGELYTGNYAGSFGFGRPAPAPFGECRRTADDAVVSCAVPHDAQDFATGVALEGPDAIDSCRDMVSFLTGIPHLEADPRLRVDVVRDDGPPTPAGVPARCQLTVTGGGMLSASLSGIGNRPLPWI